MSFLNSTDILSEILQIGELASPALLLDKIRLTSDHEVCQFQFYCSTVFLVKQGIKEIYYLERNCEFTLKNILFMSRKRLKLRPGFIPDGWLFIVIYSIILYIFFTSLKRTK